MGATAISSVMRSLSMARSTSSRSKRRWSRMVAPASAAARRLSSPRMCDGGVATWKRSSGPRPRAVHQWAVAWPIDRCVCRTALGSPVVPELKTRITSSASERPAAPESAGRERSWAATEAAAAGSSRSVTPPGPGVGEQRGRRAVGDGVAGRGQTEGVVDLDRLPRRAQQHGGRADLAGGMDRGDELDPVRRHHGHPFAGSDTLRDEVSGERVGEAVEVTEGPALVPHPDGVPRAEPVRGPLEAAVHQGRRRVHHGNIVLRSRDRRQHG